MLGIYIYNHEYDNSKPHNLQFHLSSIGQAANYYSSKQLIIAFNILIGGLPYGNSQARQQWWILL